MITVDDDDERGGYLVRATGKMPRGMAAADVVRLHMDPEAAGVFRDVGRYESFECSENGNVCVASWKVGAATIAVRKRAVGNGAINFESTADSHVRTEGSWTVDDEEDTISIRQTIAPPVPSWLPRALVRRVIRGKFRNVYDDINKTSFFKSIT